MAVTSDVVPFGFEGVVTFERSLPSLAILNKYSRNLQTQTMRSIREG